MPKIKEKVAEFRLLGDGELIEKLAETRKELFNLRFQLATGQLDNTARLREVRKDIARLSMYLRQREIELAEEGTK